MNWLRRFAVCAAALVVVSAAAQFGQLERAKGFKLVDFYSGTDGAQKKRSTLTGSEGRILTNNMIYLVHPRIEHFNEDGSLLGVATAEDAFVNVQSHTANSTSIVAFVSGDTNLYLTGRGFVWQQSNAVLIISNQSYTWINKAAFTNSPSRKQ
jgi:hypothetical protein